jgi:hypothetical protein
VKAKTFSDNMDVLCEGIMKAVEMAQPATTWTTWDSFAGRVEYHTESKRDAQKKSVKKFLTMVFADHDEEQSTQQHKGVKA